MTSIAQPIQWHQTQSVPTTLAQPTESTNRWSVAAIEALFDQPFLDLLFEAQRIHREHHAPNAVQRSTLLSIKTGGCEEDCAYCPQAARYDTGVSATKLMSPEQVRDAVMRAKEAGATRFCMGAAWRAPHDRDIEKVCDLVQEVKQAGLEACCTLGMLTPSQAAELKSAGLDYYNHNLDTSPEFYGQVITTRDYQDRLDTLSLVHDAGMKTCAGGIVGMGESRTQRAALIAQLANMDPPPTSVPINHLVQVEGTPLAEELKGKAAIDPFEFVRTIAVARITMPRSAVRLSAGRQELGQAVQALCFMAGANSIFYGEKLLTTGNPDVSADQELFEKLGLIAV